jgi:hypothetical protein
MKYVQHIKTTVTYGCWSLWLTWYNDTEAFKIYIMLNFLTGSMIDYLSMVLEHFLKKHQCCLSSWVYTCTYSYMTLTKYFLIPVCTFIYCAIGWCWMQCVVIL